MTKKTFALILVGGAAVAGAGLGVAACSDSTNNVPPPGPDGSKADTSTPIDDASGQDTSMADSSGGDAGCTHGKAPKLHPSSGDAGSLFCGFLNDAGADASADVYCNPKTQVCCVGGTMGSSGFADPTCNSKGTACTNGTGPHELDCEDPVDCQVAGAKCCFTGNAIGLDTACNYYYAKSKIATACVLPDAGGACASGDYEICTSDAQCSGGKKCTPFKSIVFSLGFCM